MTEDSLYFTHIISNILEEIVVDTEKFALLDRESRQNIQFNAKSMPKISIEQYLHRIMSLSKCEEGSIIHALILIDNLCENNDIFITRMNYHRILLISILISIKYLEDIFFSNQFYAKIGGIKLEEINELEIEFLKLIKFRVYAHEDAYIKYKSLINRQIQELKEQRLSDN